MSEIWWIKSVHILPTRVEVDVDIFDPEAGATHNLVMALRAEELGIDLKELGNRARMAAIKRLRRAIDDEEASA